MGGHCRLRKNRKSLYNRLTFNANDTIYPMRIITWNANSKNKKITKLIDYAFDKNPDVICFQELPYKTLQNITNNTNISTTFTQDFSNTDVEHNGYICTLSKLKPTNVLTFEYFHKESRSVLNTLFYKKIMHNTEHHRALTTKLKLNGKNICITNVRLSTAIGIKERLLQLQTVLQNQSRDSINIICGDLNISDSKLFNATTGLVRGFTLQELFQDERKAVEKLCNQYNFVNIFNGNTTSMVPGMLLQFDHILIPMGVNVSHKAIEQNRFGSDHKMLLVDLDI